MNEKSEKSRKKVGKKSEIFDSKITPTSNFEIFRFFIFDRKFSKKIAQDLF